MEKKTLFGLTPQHRKGQVHIINCQGCSTASNARRFSFKQSATRQIPYTFF